MRDFIERKSFGTSCADSDSEIDIDIAPCVRMKVRIWMYTSGVWLPLLAISKKKRRSGYFFWLCVLCIVVRALHLRFSRFLIFETFLLYVAATIHIPHSRNQQHREKKHGKRH